MTAVKYRVVEIAVPEGDPRPQERGHITSLMDRSGTRMESYFSPTLECALAVAALLLNGEPVPHDYHKAKDGDFSSYAIF